MKKLLLWMLALVFLVTVFSAVPASAYGYYDDYYEDEYYYDDYYEDDDSGLNVGEIFVVSVVAGFVISFILVSVKKSAMKTVRPEKTANEYVVKDSLLLTVREDIFLREHTTRTPRQKNNK